MNPLVLLPLLAAATFAAPGGIVHAFPGGTTGLFNSVQVAQPVVQVAQPVVQVAQPVVRVAQPVVQQVQVQVPLQKTIHYEQRPVVTGFSTTILKPSIAQQTVAAPVLAAPQQVVVRAEPVQQVIQPGFNNNQLFSFQLPGFPMEPPSGAPAFPAPPSGNSSDSPFPDFPQFPAPPSNGTGDAPTFPSIPAPPSQLVQLTNPFSQIVAPVQQVVQVQNDAVVVDARAAPAVVQAPVQQVVQQVVAQPQFVQQVAPVVQAPVQQVVQLRQPQAGDFEPLVTQERVLAPVRQHTQITPQLTQVQPEVTVRKVIHDVPVQQPIYQTPVVHQTVVAPQQVHQVVAQPQLVAQQQFVAQPQWAGAQLAQPQWAGLRSVVV